MQYHSTGKTSEKSLLATTTFKVGVLSECDKRLCRETFPIKIGHDNQYYRSDCYLSIKIKQRLPLQKNVKSSLNLEKPFKSEKENLARH